MTMEISTSNGAPAKQGPPPIAAEQLLRMRTRELEPLFARGTIARVDELGVNPRGYVLALPVFGLERGFMLDATRLVTASPLFAWEGKSFYAQKASEGRGENRLRLPL